MTHVVAMSYIGTVVAFYSMSCHIVVGAECKLKLSVLSQPGNNFNLSGSLSHCQAICCVSIYVPPVEVAMQVFAASL